LPRWSLNLRLASAVLALLLMSGSAAAVSVLDLVSRQTATPSVTPSASNGATALIVVRGDAYVIPEPTTAALLIAGGFTLLWTGSRRSR
jgi:hypothetical protein